VLSARMWFPECRPYVTGRYAAVLRCCGAAAVAAAAAALAAGVPLGVAAASLATASLSKWRMQLHRLAGAVLLLGEPEIQAYRPRRLVSRRRM